jgi:hypothetical protein
MESLQSRTGLPRTKTNGSGGKTNDFGAALILMILAPLSAEILPGATRFSSIFVFPVEVVVWGGGALMIRYVVRRKGLGWGSLVLMGLALAIAEECIIQQTSLAPLVIRLKGVTYARALGVNYVYLLWALVYETVFVVVLPVYLCEFLFPSRRFRPWISKGGFFVVIPLFLLGSLLAWYSWTHIARTRVFHLPAYTPPAPAIIFALLAIGVLILTALRRPVAPSAFSWSPAPSLVLILGGVIWATLLYGLVVLGFGGDPDFPPLAAVGAGFLLAAAALLFVPRWAAHPRWSGKASFDLIFGLSLGAMGSGFIGFIGTTGADLYFKVVTNLIAIVLLILLRAKS